MAHISRLAFRTPLRTALLLVSLAAGAALALWLSSASGSSITSTGAAPASVAPVVAGSFTGGIEPRAVVTQGETFFKATISRVVYDSGAVVLAGSKDGSAGTLVDDVLIVKVVHADKTTSTFKHDYSNGCGGPSSLPPTDLSSKFKPGANKVTATLKDACGGAVSSGALWLRGLRHVYWSNSDEGTTIGRADVDGSNVNQSFIGGASGLEGVAVDANYVYWANNNSGTIGRANLDGSNVNQSFIGGVFCPGGVAVDGNFVYWANFCTGTIGRANLDGSNPNQSFIGGASGSHGVAVDANYVYWANSSTDTIGRANLDGSNPNQSFIGGASGPLGVAVDANFVYWSNANSFTIGRANLDGSNPNQSFIGGASAPFGVAVDGNFVYWANQNSGTIGRANLDGSNPNQSFIGGASGPKGVAVDAG